MKVMNVIMTQTVGEKKGIKSFIKGKTEWTLTCRPADAADADCDDQWAEL